MWYIYLHLVEFYGKCRQIYHTWMVWVWKKNQQNPKKGPQTLGDHLIAVSCKTGTLISYDPCHNPHLEDDSIKVLPEHVTNHS